MAELLGLQLPTREVKSNLLTEVLLQNPQATEPLLSFHEAVADLVLAVWEKPTSAPAASRVIARRYKPAPDDSPLSFYPSNSGEPGDSGIMRYSPRSVFSFYTG